MELANRILWRIRHTNSSSGRIFRTSGNCACNAHRRSYSYNSCCNNNNPLFNCTHSKHSKFKLNNWCTNKSANYSTLSDLQTVKLITFDITGTLLTFRQPPIEIYKNFGARYGIRCETEKIKLSFKTQWKDMNEKQPHFGTDWEAWWTEFVIRTFKGAEALGVNDKNINKVASELIDHFKTTDCWKFKDGAEELIDSLRTSTQPNIGSLQKLVAVGIISNFDPRLHKLLRAFKVDKLFTPVIILSHEHQTSKPSPKMFNLALESFKRAFPDESIQPCEALHVGDNYELDFLGAKHAGWKSCLIAPNFNILDIPENKRNILPITDEIHEDLHSFKEFLLR